MVSPHKVPVAPFVRTSDSGVALRLDDLFADRLARGVSRPLVIRGASGSGKTMALEYLRPQLDAAGYQGLDEPGGVLGVADRLVLTSKHDDDLGFPHEICVLQPWGEDEVLEWLMTERRDVCASVMTRLRASGEQDWLLGNPRLWVMCLEHMAVDSSLQGPLAAIYAILGELIVGDDQTSLADRILAVLSDKEFLSLDSLPTQPAIASRGVACSVLGHQTVLQILVAEVLLESLTTGRCEGSVEDRFCEAVYVLAARRCGEDPSLLPRVRRELAGNNESQGVVCSIIVRVNPAWRPDDGVLEDLSNAFLQGVQWSGVRMPSCDLTRVDFTGADLRDADMSGSPSEELIVDEADLSGARLEDWFVSRSVCRNAKLVGVRAKGSTWYNVDFRGANFTESRFGHAGLFGADLRDTTWHAADLRHSQLRDVLLDGADFSDACFGGAVLAKLDWRGTVIDRVSFRTTKLYDSNFEGIHAVGMDLRMAQANNTLWTNSRLRDCTFAEGILAGAGLAGVDWEGIDLRFANLRRASFHTGTSRSGLVDSTIASEGSRTGFYTDELRELFFRSPEEIRVANLSGADLRGAKLDFVDFYLVDLRGAKLDPAQFDLAKRMGAIL